MFKTLFIAAISAVAVNASAADKSQADIVKSWLSEQAPSVDKAANIKGKTPDGKACGLYVTDKYGGVYFVVVGYSDTKDMDQYIGVVSTDSSSSRTQANVTFASANPWGNNSRYNLVDVKTDDKGKPVRAVGISDLLKIDCRLN